MAEIADATYVLASIAHPRVLAHRLEIYQFDAARPDAPMRLVSTYAAQDGGVDRGLWIVSDGSHQRHPVTGQELAYVAHWDRGIRIVDITDPAAPVEIGAYDDPAPSDYLMSRSAFPAPALIDGRHYTIATNACYYAPAPCFVRILDTTDPAAPEQVGTWTLPGEGKLADAGQHYAADVAIDADGLVHIAFAHAGVWVIDIGSAELARAPRIAGYYATAGGREAGVEAPWFGSIGLKGERVLARDFATGLHVLSLTTAT